MFTDRDVARVAAAARAAGATLVMTTEKDAVRLAGRSFGTLPAAAVPLIATIEPAAAFADWLLDRLRTARSTQHSALSTQHRAPSTRGMRHRLEYLIVKVFIAVLRVMPDSVVRVSGSLLGLAFHTFDRAHRRIAERNLATAFPSRTAGARRAIGRGAFKHFGRLLFELLKFSTLSPEAMLARVEFDGEERARAAYAHGKGVLFFTGHFGFWEVHAIAHALQIEPIGVLARARSTTSG